MGSQTYTDHFHPHLFKVVKQCEKIRVAKTETSQLVDVCGELANSLSDRNYTANQINREDALRVLVEIETQMTAWSKFSYPKSLMKKKEIREGTAEFVEKLKTIVETIRPGPSEEREDDRTSIVIVDERDVSDSSRQPRVRATTQHDQRDQQLRRPTLEQEAPRSDPLKRLDGEIVIPNGEVAYTGGINCEIWKVRWNRGGEENINGEVAGNTVVALKSFRMTKMPEKARKVLERELTMWAQLADPRILPLLGIIGGSGSCIYMVTQWCKNGNLLAYVKNNPEADKMDLLRGCAIGLNYLHANGIIHLGIKCANVLIADNGKPMICDIGIALIAGLANEDTVSKTGSYAIARHTAPEIIENGVARATTHSDVWSFAMMVLECMTEYRPYPNISRDVAVIHLIIAKRETPQRPYGMDGKSLIADDLWRLLGPCWSYTPEARPKMETLMLFFIHKQNYLSKEDDSETTWNGIEFPAGQFLTVKGLHGFVMGLREEKAISDGTHCKVWVGQWRAGGRERGGNEAESFKVAVKAFRVVKLPEGVQKKLESELESWGELQNEHMLPLLGTIWNKESHLCLVTPWCKNGNILTYAKNNPQVSKMELLRGCAKGLMYLHSIRIAHLCIKCTNVLISDYGQPLIYDIGATRILGATNEDMPVESMGISRYLAPEIILYGVAKGTTRSDVWSFGMLMLECITEKPPYSYIPGDATVSRVVRGKQIPRRPKGRGGEPHIADDLWEFMKGCWSFEPEARSKMDDAETFITHKCAKPSDPNPGNHPGSN